MSVLILTAAIGEGHDLPARVLAEELQALRPDLEVEVADSLAVVGWPLESLANNASPVHSRWGNRLFDVEYWLITHFPPTRWLMGWLLYAFAARRVRSFLLARRPQLIVSTYPGSTEVLGRLRARGRLDVPVVSAITDLAALRYWSHPHVDLHLVTHPESVDEVRRIAGVTEVVPVRGLNSSEFLEPRNPAEARRALDLPADPKVVLVSGGGWAVGDLDGAVTTALALPETFVVVLCGRNAEVRARVEAAFRDEPRVRVLGFTDRMSDLLAAADVLVHSTAGLTVLEAHLRGCPTISYGWGRAHIRANNRAFRRFGLAEVATDTQALAAALPRALAGRRDPDLSFAALPSAASVVLARLARDHVGHDGGPGQDNGADDDHAQGDGDQCAAQRGS